MAWRRMATSSFYAAFSILGGDEYTPEPGTRVLIGSRRSSNWRAWRRASGQPRMLLYSPDGLLDVPDARDASHAHFLSPWLHDHVEA